MVRILSRHHDYYDWVAGYGVNPAITYERTPTSLAPTAENLPWRMNAHLDVSTVLRAGHYLRFEVLIGIFPEVYRRWMVLLHRSDSSSQVRIFESESAAQTHGESLGLAPYRRPYWRWYAQESQPDGRLPDERWRRVGAPIFALAPIGWPGNRLTMARDGEELWYTTNPILQDLRFTEVPAQDVFQRVQSFLRLDPPPPAEFEDAQKIQARGFDGQSFRHRKKGKR